MTHHIADSIYTPGTPLDPANLPEGINLERLLKERFGFGAELAAEFDISPNAEHLDTEQVLADLLADESAPLG